MGRLPPQNNDLVPQQGILNEQVTARADGVGCQAESRVGTSERHQSFPQETNEATDRGCAEAKGIPHADVEPRFNVAGRDASSGELLQRLDRMRSVASTTPGKSTNWENGRMDMVRPATSASAVPSTPITTDT
jgi:hypothetical protein